MTYSDHLLFLRPAKFRPGRLAKKKSFSTLADLTMEPGHFASRV